MPEDSITKFAQEVSRLLPEIIRESLKRQAGLFMQQGNMSLAQLFVLSLLKDCQLMRMGDLAKHLSVSMAATTGIVNKLVKNGLVIRTSSPNDRRIVNISITPKGRKIIDELNENRQKLFIEIFGSLTEADRDKYLEILAKVHGYLKRENKD